MTADERRKAIVSSTLPLLLAQGPELSTREIASAAGVAEGTIFRAFETKDELIKAVVGEAMRPTATLTALADLEAGHTLEQRVTAVLEILTTDLQRVRALFSHLAKAGFGSGHGPHPHPHGPGGPDPRKDARSEVFRATTAALEPYADALSVPPTTAARLLTALAFASNFTLDSVESSPSPDALASLVLHGIAKGEE